MQQLNLEKLKREQLQLAKKIVLRDAEELSGLKLIAGCDQAFVDDRIVSAVVVLSYPDFKLVEWQHAAAKETMPYIPGFLSYRESPVVLEAFAKLKHRPQLLMVDGNGIIHHRKIGMASHLGLLLDIPTIGVAKKLLMGQVQDGKVLIDSQQRGFAIQSREHAKSIYVSPGHKVSLKTSLSITKKCLTGHKLPEPLHLAHKYSLVAKRKVVKEREE